MKSLSRTLGVWLALWAMLLRAGVPDGWMPNPAGSAGVPIVICTAQGFVHIAPEHRPGRLPPSDHGGQACPFGALGHFAPPQVAALAGPAFNPASESVRSSTNIFARASNIDAHGPRAPPVIL